MMTARFLALYETPADPGAFERHYREVHIPLLRQLRGLRRYSVARDLTALHGTPYYLVTELEWDTMDELRAAFASPEGQATAADAARLQELAPVCRMIFTVDDHVMQVRGGSEGDPGLITIADAVPGDEDAIAALCREMDDYYSQPTAGIPQQRAGQVRAVFFTGPPMARALLAWDGPALAGLASYSFLWPAVGLSASLYLKELYVAAACRRAGTGTLLMNRLFAVAAEKGCSRVEWTTDVGNTSARAFYEALGATPLSAKIFYRMATLPSGR